MPQVRGLVHALREHGLVQKRSDEVLLRGKTIACDPSFCTTSNLASVSIILVKNGIGTYDYQWCFEDGDMKEEQSRHISFLNKRLAAEVHEDESPHELDMDSTARTFQCVFGNYPQMASLCNSGIADFCYAGADILLYGPHALILKWDQELGEVEFVVMDDILKTWEITQEQFIEICLLAGYGACRTNSLFSQGFQFDRVLEEMQQYKTADRIMEKYIGNHSLNFTSVRNSILHSMVVAPGGSIKGLFTDKDLPALSKLPPAILRGICLEQLDPEILVKGLTKVLRCTGSLADRKLEFATSKALREHLHIKHNAMKWAHASAASIPDLSTNVSQVGECLQYCLGVSRLQDGILVYALQRLAETKLSASNILFYCLALSQARSLNGSASAPLQHTHSLFLQLLSYATSVDSSSLTDQVLELQKNFLFLIQQKERLTPSDADRSAVRDALAKVGPEGGNLIPEGLHREMMDLIK